MNHYILTQQNLEEFSWDNNFIRFCLAVQTVEVDRYNERERERQISYQKQLIRIFGVLYQNFEKWKLGNHNTSLLPLTLHLKNYNNIIV